MLKGNEGIKVGDVFLALWGYEQTNASYYQVVRIAGKTMVEVRRIRHKLAKAITDMTQDVIPVVDEFKDDELIRKKVHRYGSTPSIELSDFEHASLIIKDEAGNYPTASTSSYY